MTGPLPESARSIFAALSAELGHASVKAHALTALIAHAAGAGSGAEAHLNAVRDAQSLDALIQHIEALADVSRRLAEGERLEDAIETIPLAEVAQRMGTSLGLRADEAASAVADGDLDLFD